MTGYLGMRPRTVAAYVAAAVTAGALLGAILPAPDPAPCGYVVEDTELVPAACMTPAEVEAWYAEVRAARAGGRW
jgi:hypothetical protein